MRTTLELPDSLIHEAMSLTHKYQPKRKLLNMLWKILSNGKK